MRKKSCPFLVGVPIGPTEDPTLGERGLIFVHLGLGDMSLSWQCGWRTMSPIGHKADVTVVVTNVSFLAIKQT
jgi:hypothetical protein